MVSRRCYETELKPGGRPEDIFDVQYKCAEFRTCIRLSQLIYLSVFMVIMYWHSNAHFHVDPQLRQMRNFCESAIQMRSSSTMVGMARNLLRQIDVSEF